MIAAASLSENGSVVAARIIMGFGPPDANVTLSPGFAPKLFPALQPLAGHSVGQNSLGP